jgi:hypothetical protein
MMATYSIFSRKMDKVQDYFMEWKEDSFGGLGKGLENGQTKSPKR